MKHSQIKAKPIIFSTEMVEAIKQGRKTQTRRVIKLSPLDGCDRSPEDCTPWFYNYYFGLIADGQLAFKRRKAPYKPGDILYIRQKYGTDGHNIFLDGEQPAPTGLRWFSSRHMPREAAKWFLRVKSIRPERLWHITEQDAEAEGVTRLDQGCFEDNGWSPTYGDPDSGGLPVLRNGFRRLWNKLNAKRGYCWEINPFVWVIEFELYDE